METPHSDRMPPGGDTPAGGWRPRPGLIVAAFAATLGGGMLWLSRDYAFVTMGTAGPAYVARIVSVLLLLLAGLQAARALGAGRALAGAVAPRPALVVTAALLLFAFAMEHAGFVIAALAMVPLSAAAQRRSDPWAVIGLAIGLTVAGVVLFKVLLKTGMKVWP